jgi:ATP-dependent helicase/nuclease subunit B
MAAIADRVVIDLQHSAATPWPAIARQAREWLARHALSQREAIVLLPFAQLLPPARRAFAAQDGWQPLVATTQTLAASLAPSIAPATGQLSFDVAIDRLSAAQLLRAQSWAAEWPRRDPQGFEQRVGSLVDAAHEFARAAGTHAPALRDAWWARARLSLAPSRGPGATQVLLARVALEWAAACAAPATDALFDLRPSAWIVVRCGGPDAQAEALLAQAACPTLCILTDPPAAEPFAALARDVDVDLTLCDSPEDEARSACARIIEVLDAGPQLPVALIAQDRVLVRRVRALLERSGVAVRDETGWKLSTTRAAAQVMCLLRAAGPRASTDAVLEWLKSDAAGQEHAMALERLEAQWRRQALRRRDAVSLEDLDAGPRALWSSALPRLQRLATTARQSLGEWLAALRESLLAAGNRERFDSDPAARQVLSVLHVSRVAVPDSAFAAAREMRLDLAGFIAWVDAALESASFVPPEDADARVVITPLARAMLRPFAAAVLPGTDEKRLGAASAPDALLGEALRRELGLPDGAQRRELEALAFAHLLRGSPVHLLRRRREGSEPLAASPLVERLDLALRRAGRVAGLPLAEARFAWRELAAKPVVRPLPRAPQALPAALSASAVEALRDCPYRFFASVLLGLREDDELDLGVAKRDYGTWLHAVLLRFHRERGASRSPDADLALLHTAARDERAASGLDEAELLPFSASFERLAPRYVAWLQRRDAEGWQFQEGEVDRRLQWPELEGLALRGRIDRIDRRGAALHLIDYKTGAAGELAHKVRHPLEDTQLAFYAALLREDAAQALSASYLALDDSEAPKDIVHPDVAESAAALIEGLAADLRELRGGAALPALGEGAACRFCVARGLCRRDHWPDGEEALA